MTTSAGLWLTKPYGKYPDANWDTHLELLQCMTRVTTPSDRDICLDALSSLREVRTVGFQSLEVCPFQMLEFKNPDSPGSESLRHITVWSFQNCVQMPYE